MPDAQDQSYAHSELAHLQSYLSQPYQILGVEVVVSFSVGVSLSQNTITDAEELVSYADSTLHASRQHGHGTIDFYLHETQERLIHNLSLEAAIKRAFEKEEFLLYYQPFFHLGTQLVSGVEALIRWQHPDLGLLMPKDFLHVAEESGFIKLIGSWVIKEACRQLGYWQKNHSLDLNVAVNLSAKQFLAGDLSQLLNKNLGMHNLEPAKIELELTEQQLLENSDLVQTQMNELRDQGYNLVIDDFGVGYSSLQYLNIFPVNKIKIDRSFIVHDTDKHREILKAILLLAKQLSLKTLCEGVETREQFNNLSYFGCNEIQGFLFCPPLMPQDIPSFIKINNNQRLLLGLLN